MDAELEEIDYEFDANLPIACYDSVTIIENFSAEVICVRFRVQWRRKERLPDIKFTHIETDEPLPAGTQEMVEEIVAEGLFKMWLSEMGAKVRS